MMNQASTLNSIGVELLASSQYAKAEATFRDALLCVAMDRSRCSPSPGHYEEEDFLTVQLKDFGCEHFHVCHHALHWKDPAAPRSAVMMSSVIQFNLALCMHQLGSLHNTLHHLQEALYFYQQAADTTLAFGTKSCQSMALVMTALNNQSQILYCFDWFSCSQLSVEQLEYNRGVTFSLIHHMCYSTPKETVTQPHLDLINEVVLNWTVVTVLRLPSNAACA